jgi:hypothetical protein
VIFIFASKYHENPRAIFQLMLQAILMEDPAFSTKLLPSGMSDMAACTTGNVNASPLSRYGT